jgi:DNA ligase D-like protein (predicted 3'-phosphoesterase)
MNDDPLEIYRLKRNFNRTPEPPGSQTLKSSSHPIFVIQKHAARTLHYDLRLEIDGVLKSWAVPKGPSTNPKDKRLAVPTEDHPLEYATFEGMIPEHHYGAGPVIVWDIGTYHNITEKSGKLVPASEALTLGHFSFYVKGKKINGGYALRRFKSGDDEAWLLIKMADEYADPNRNPVLEEPQSVLSGRTIEQVVEEES